MKKILCVGKGVCKVMFIGLVMAGTFIMNVIGFILCAVTEG